MDLNEFLKIDDIKNDFTEAARRSVWALAGGGTGETVPELFQKVAAAVWENVSMYAGGRYLDIKKADTEKAGKIEFIVYDSFLNFPNAAPLLLLVERINKVQTIEALSEAFAEVETVSGTTSAHADETTGGSRESNANTTEKYNPVAAASSYTGGVTDSTGREQTTAEANRDSTATNNSSTKRGRASDSLIKEITELKNFLAEFAQKFKSAYTFSAWQLEEFYYYF